MRFTGARSSADIEHNGLTLNGVGRGTTIKNLYITDGADDAIEFFGGTVNVENILAVNCDDDMFDFTQGYKGTLSNCYGVWEAGYTSTEEDHVEWKPTVTWTETDPTTKDSRISPSRT